MIATLLLLAGCDKQADDKQVDDKKADKKADKQTAKQPTEKADDKQADVEPPEPKPAAAPVLTLGAAKLTAKDKPDQAFELLADGTLKLGPDPEHTLVITTDGRVSGVDGKLIAQVAADGSLSFDGKPSGVVLNDTGLTLSSPDGKTVTVVFGEDGSVNVDPPAGEGMQFVAEGCTGAMAKTCGLVMTVLVLKSEPDAATPEPAAATPEPASVDAKGRSRRSHTIEPATPGPMVEPAN